MLVDRLDLAVLRALRYAGSLRPTELRVVHLALDDVEAAALERQWIERGLCDRYPLQIVECTDRRLVRAITELAYDTVVTEAAEVTLLLPRRSFRTLSQRLLHDRTADRIAEAVGADTARRRHHRPVRHHAAARGDGAARAAARRRRPGSRPSIRAPDVVEVLPRADGTTPIHDVTWRQKVTVQGRIKSVQLGATAGRSLEVLVHDGTGGLRLLFMGRTNIAGITAGATIRATGRVGEYRAHLAIANPAYELLVPVP